MQYPAVFMCVHTFLGACLCTISSHHPIGSTVQCALSPFGNTASAGLVAIPRNTNLSALENIWSNDNAGYGGTGTIKSVDKDGKVLEVVYDGREDEDEGEGDY